VTSPETSLSGRLKNPEGMVDFCGFLATYPKCIHLQREPGFHNLSPGGPAARWPGGNAEQSREMGGKPVDFCGVLDTYPKSYPKRTPRQSPPHKLGLSQRYICNPKGAPSGPGAWAHGRMSIR
jgi:hypothetical protein